MKKKLFLKFFVLAVIGAFVTFTSCKDYDDDINNLQSQIDKISTSVAELKAKIDAGAVITKVETTNDGVKVTLSDGKTFNLTNGKDGATGATGAKGDKGDKGDTGAKGDKGDTGAAGAAGKDGKPGTVWTIGANGNWFVDNGDGNGAVDSGKPSRGDKGDKGDQGDKGDKGDQGDKGDKGDQGDKGDKGDQGDKGDKGDQGDKGKDGVYYVPNEDGYWYKHDGDNVTKEGLWLLPSVITAVVDEYGNVTLNNVKAGDGVTSITFYNQKLTSISLAPRLYIGGIEALEFTSISYNCVPEDENKALPTVAPNKYTSAPITAPYKFNPRSFNTAYANYQYVDSKSEVRSTALPASSLVNIEGDPVYNATDGTVDFTLRRKNAHINSTTNSNSGNKNFITLEATLQFGEDNEVIAAHKELVQDILLTQGQLHLGDNAASNQCGTGFVPYKYTFNEAKTVTVYDDMVYNEDFDLGSRVRSCFGGVEYDVEDFNLHYEFDMPNSKYNITEGSTTTDQQTYFELVDGEKGIFKAIGYNKEAIGRTPIFKVEVVDANGCVVRRAFVKVEVVAKKFEDKIVNKFENLAFQCNETKTTYKYDVPYIRENVYRVLETSTGHVSISHEEFWNTYEFDSSVVTKNGSSFTMTAPIIVDGPTSEGVATKEVHWTFNHSELGTIGSNGSVFVATLTVKNKLASSEFPEYVKFVFTVKVEWPTWSLDKVENQVYWTYQDQENHVGPIWYNANVAVPAAVDSPAHQAIFRTSLPQAYTKYDLTLTPGTKCEGINTYYEIVATHANGVKTNPKLSGVQIDGDFITLQKNNTAVKEALNSAGGLQATVQHWYELNNGDKFVINTFVVNFVRPVNLNMPSGVTVKDAKTGGDVADFHWNGILTDWRGNAIVAPEWGWHEHDNSYWRYNHTPEFTWVDGHYVEVSPASVSLVTEQVSFVLGSTVEVIEGEATFLVQRRTWNYGSIFPPVLPGWNAWTTISTVAETSEEMLSQSQVDMYLDAKLLELQVAQPSNVPFVAEYRVIETGARTYTPSTMTTGQTISFTNVIGINYTPAVTDWVPGNWTMVPHIPTPMPTFNGTSAGQIVGDWVWTPSSWGHATWDPGQYWFFYGQFGIITAHVNQATTNLTYNNGQLPTNATLTQVGNTIKYVNVHAPVGYTYEIYVPVTVTYGWGEVSSVFTITVLPSI